jgi:hypothetical protein
LFQLANSLEKTGKPLGKDVLAEQKIFFEGINIKKLNELTQNQHSIEYVLNHF